MKIAQPLRLSRAILLYRAAQGIGQISSKWPEMQFHLRGIGEVSRVPLCKHPVGGR